MDKEIRCSSCGKKCLETDKYCRYCHSTIEVYNLKEEKMLEGIEIERWKQFINKNPDNYIKVFKKNEGKRFFVDFNIAAYFFSVAWMLYRKMYLEALITQILSWLCLLSIPVFYIIDSPLMLMGIPVVVGFYIVMGFISDWLYKNFCMKHLLSSSQDMQRGGTSFGIAAIGYVIISFITGFVIYPLAVLLTVLF